MFLKLSALQLRTRIVLLVCVTVLLALATTGLLVTLRLERQTLEAMTERAVLVSRLSAEAGPVVEGLAARGPTGAIQAFTDHMQGTTGVDYVVVLDPEGRRISHPNPALIGDRFVGGDEAAVFQGQTYTSVARGTLGKALRAFTPVRDKDGRQLGAVVVGVLTTGIVHDLMVVRRMILAGILVGFAVGAAGAVTVAAQVKRILMGMEPREIAAMLQQRMAILHSVREGILAVDRDMRITVLNEEASRLFRQAGLQGAAAGARAATLLPDSGLETVLATGRAELDQEQTLNGLQLLTSRVPVAVDGVIVGAVATFRDKSELSLLAEQLTGVRLYADALRAQTHEFMNKLHVILGLIRLGEHDRLGSYITDITQRFQGELGNVVRAVKDPVLAGFLLARFSAAREQDIGMVLADDAAVPPCTDPALTHDAVTILGNLLENAVEAIGAGPSRTIAVALGWEAGWLAIQVEDSGPGLAQGAEARIFAKGYSTKGPGRGYGLYHVMARVQARGGRFAAGESPLGGARFTASLPFPAEEETP